MRHRVEAKVTGLKAFGERIMSRDPDRQTAEIPIRIAPMTRFNALVTAEIEAAVQTKRERANLALSHNSTTTLGAPVKSSRFCATFSCAK